MLITKEILKDLRAATTLVVRRDVKGNGSVKVIIEDKIHGKSVRVDKTWLTSVNITSYDDNLSYDEKKSQYCIAIVDLYKESVEATAIKMIKVDDIIAFEFIGSNNNQVMRDAGFHHDQLRLRVSRGRDYFRFSLEDKVSLDNSARMVGSKSNFNSDIDIHSYDLENRVIPEETTV